MICCICKQDGICMVVKGKKLCVKCAEIKLHIRDKRGKKIEKEDKN